MGGESRECTGIRRRYYLDFFDAKMFALLPPAFLMLKLPEMLRDMGGAPTADASSPKGAVFKGLRLFLASTSLVDLADTKTQADTALLFLQVCRH